MGVCGRGEGGKHACFTGLLGVGKDADIGDGSVGRGQGGRHAWLMGLQGRAPVAESFDDLWVPAGRDTSSTPSQP